jgi:hypothetical protein
VQISSQFYLFVILNCSIDLNSKKYYFFIQRNYSKVLQGCEKKDRRIGCLEGKRKVKQEFATCYNQTNDSRGNDQGALEV